jgi:preprotein translocase subunit SecE
MASSYSSDPRASKVQRTPVPRSSAPRQGIVRSFGDIVAELRKVIWPSWGELRTMTMVVVATVIVVSIMLGIIDYILSHTLIKFEFPSG